MSTPRSTPRGGSWMAGNGDLDDPLADMNTPYSAAAAAPPTYAAFSSSNLSSTAAKRRSTILVHQKSPLLLATPPQITRALAYSHPFLLPLNKLAGLLSWTTGDAWESFLLLVVFWAVVQYGDVVMRWAGPIVAVLGIIAGMYARRYSPLSSSGWVEHPSWSNTNPKDKGRKTATAAAGAAGSGDGAGAKGKGKAHARNASEMTGTRHQKTLDEIVETLKVFTTRCNILLEPLMEMTDFLSTQRTPTSATTRPALTTLFVRILAVTPVWFILTLPPLHIITTKRVVMVFGTLVLTWHSRVCRVTRTVLWRSATIRKLARWVTGLEFQEPVKTANPKVTLNGGKLATVNDKSITKNAKASQSTSALTAALKRGRSYGGKDTGVRFTFILYENQRRWVGLGWTNSLFAYERAAWTDEHNNAVPPKDEFELPEVEDGHARWQWVEDSKWRVDGVSGDLQDENDYDTEAGKMGWIYYDTKWNGGRRGQDGWGRWTRRRKWYRDAELVEVDSDQEEQEQDAASTKAASPPPPELPARPQGSSLPTENYMLSPTPSYSAPSTSPPAYQDEDADSVSLLSTSSRSASRFKRPGSMRRRATDDSARRSRRTSQGSMEAGEPGMLTPALELEIQGQRRDRDSWGVGDEVILGLD